MKNRSYAVMTRFKDKAILATVPCRYRVAECTEPDVMTRLVRKAGFTDYRVQIGQHGAPSHATEILIYQSPNKSGIERHMSSIFNYLVW